MRTIIRPGFLLLLIALTSCSYLSTRESVSPIIDTELPETAVVGETISFKIYHVVYNGCGKYSRQETTMDGRTVTVTFYAKYPNGGACPDNIPTLEGYCTFVAKEKGDYYFRFYHGNYSGDEFILDTLSVQ